MNIKYISIISVCTCMIGIFTFLFMNEYIIFQIPQKTSPSNLSALPSKQTKNIRLFYWHTYRWHYETDDIVWSDNIHEDIKTILIRWLDFLHEEQCLPLNVVLQSVMVSHDATIAYISFTASPLNTNAPTIDNLLFIKSLLRTLQENKVPIHAISFLENHTPLHHDKLDFTRPWPLHCLNQLPY